MEHKYIEINIIDSTATKNPVYRTIQNTINTYLIKNRGAISDFNLIKDIVDRNTDSLESEINAQIPIPLYLGLVGTMLGIVVGLFTMPSISDDNFDQSIDILIGGVKIAMIASLVGITLTTYLSGWLFKGAKNQAEYLKNQFYSWVLTNLLPVLTQNTTSSLYSLQTNLMKFNDTFTDNVGEFKTVLSEISVTFDSQRQIMEELKRVDVSEMANININVLKQVKDTTNHFEKFNYYLSNVNSLLENTQILNSSINAQLGKTHAIEDVAAGIKTTVQSNEQMMNLMQNEIKQIQDRKEIYEGKIIEAETSFKKAYDRVQNVVVKSLDQLSENQTLKGDTIKIDTQKLEKNLTDSTSKLEKMAQENSIAIQNALNQMDDKLEAKIEQHVSKSIQSQLELQPVLKYGLYAFVGSGAIIGVSFILSYLYQFIK